MISSINNLKQPFKDQNKTTKFYIFSSFIALLLFIISASIFPFKDKINQILYPIYSSKAANNNSAVRAINVKKYQPSFSSYAKLSDFTKLMKQNPTATNSSYTTSQGYIIQLKNDPVAIKFKTQLTSNYSKAKTLRVNNPALISQISTYRNQLLTDHASIKQQITSLTGKNIVTGSTQNQIQLLGDYTSSFNGLALLITQNDLNKIKSSPLIKSITPNYKVYAQIYDSAPLIGATYVWSLTDSNGVKVTGKNVTIAILDTGIDYTHPDFGSCSSNQVISKTCPKIIDSYNFINNSLDPMDDYGHGTHVSGIAAGNGALSGIARDANLVEYKVLNNVGQGLNSTIMTAVERVMDPNQDGNYIDHWDIMNLSLGNTYDSPLDPLAVSVNNAANVGVIPVIAAGNSGPYGSSIGSPGTAPNAITVGAADKSSVMASFSSIGPVPLLSGSTQGYLKPDITAPGVSICEAEWGVWLNTAHCYDNSHIFLSGTSMATPHIAGVAALIKQMHPDWTFDQIKGVIISSATDLHQPYLIQGGGMVNALYSVTASTTVSPGSLSIPITDNSPSVNVSGSITVKNSSQTSLNYTVTSSGAPNGFKVNLSNSTFTLAAGQSQTVTITYNINNSIVSSGTYNLESDISDGHGLYVIPTVLFKQPMQITLTPNVTKGTFVAQVSTPNIILSNPPTLVMTSPSGSNTTISPLISQGTSGGDPTLWTSNTITLTEPGNYSLVASTPEYTNYTASSVVTLDQTAPILTINSGSTGTSSANVSVLSNKLLSPPYNQKMIDSPLNYYRYLAWFPSVYSHSNMIYSVYETQIQISNNSQGPRSLYFVKSTNQGSTWSAPVKIIDIVDDMTVNSLSAVSVLNGKIYVVFSDDAGMHSISSTDLTGNAWNSPLFIDNSFISGWSKVYLIADNNKLHLGYSTFSSILYRSFDGTNWSNSSIVAAPSNLPLGDSLSGFGLTVNNGVIQIVYSQLDGAVFYSHSSDGVNWQSSSIDNFLSSADYPTVVSSGNNIYATWSSNGYGKINFANSQDGGNTWTVTRDITHAQTNNDWIPQIVLANNNLYIAILRDIISSIEIIQSSDFGKTWSNPYSLYPNKGSVYVPTISSDGTYFHAITPLNTFSYIGGIDYVNNTILSLQQNANNLSQYIPLYPFDSTNKLLLGQVNWQGNTNYSFTASGQDVAGNSTSSTSSFSLGPFSCSICSADVNSDGNVNLTDFSAVSGCFNMGSSSKLPNGDACIVGADVNKDGIIDQIDENCVQSQFGKQCPANVKPTPTSSPTNLLNMTYTPSSVTITVAKGAKTSSIMKISSTNTSGSTHYLLSGYPTSYGQGINWSTTSNQPTGYVNYGSPIDINVSVYSNVPSGTYKGGGVLINADNNAQVTIPFTVIVP